MIRVACWALALGLAAGWALVPARAELDEGWVRCFYAYRGARC